MPDGIGSHQHELALAVERVRYVVERVEVRVPEHGGCNGRAMSERAQRNRFTVNHLLPAADSRRSPARRDARSGRSRSPRSPRLATSSTRKTASRRGASGTSWEPGNIRNSSVGTV